MIAIIAVTKNGKKLAGKLSLNLVFSSKNKLYFPAKGALKGTIREIFSKSNSLAQGKDGDRFEGIIFIMALGIVVRLIAPCLKDKYRDPAVVVVDETGRFAISALCGHEGRANELAIEVSNILSGEPVITTASEAMKKYVVGIGSRRAVTKEEVITAVRQALSRAKCGIEKVRCFATLDLKKNEPGIKKACLELGIPLRIISSDLVKNFTGSYNRSSFVREKVGIEGVSEPCALLTAKNSKIILPKQKIGRVTVALARED